MRHAVYAALSCFSGGFCIPSFLSFSFGWSFGERLLGWVWYEKAVLNVGALWHVPGGYGMRDLVEGSHAIVPSTTKIGPAGTAIDIPIHHRVAAYVRSHFDSLEVRVADSPRPDELMLVIAMTTGPRPHARVGGLRADEIAKFDGQR